MGTPRTSTKASFLDGLAQVSVSENEVIVELGGTDYRFDREDAPEKVFTGQMYVKMSDDGTRFWDIKPSGGTHVVGFQKFSHKEDSPPEYNFKRGGPRDGYYEQDSYYTTALFKVLEGPFEGVTVAKYLPLTDTKSNFLFYPYDTGDRTITGFSTSNNTRARAYKLEQFLTICGYDWESDELPFSDNILPALQRILLSKERRLMAVLSEKGWINDLVELPMGA